ncbi:hypothetical protein LTR62_004110 [Meristemomyces frigidus]|uniref:protein-tyrosine-phosphatase n=1 Tax=Meristemomyces frigidus TaxID=1508187 RepID=A0AAN7TQ90_9PEZI|nr:hypothetical protein LTR62_004110 [Meristemomyces frigidus]
MTAETARSPLFARPTKTPTASTAMSTSYFLNAPHQPTPTKAKSPSPNYFGFQAHDTTTHHADSPQHAKQNWSPPSSAIRSTAAASPSVIAVDQSPEYDAFRRQSEGQSFNLGGLGGDFKMSNVPPARAKVGRTVSKPSEKEGPPRPRDVPHRRISSKESLDPSAAELSRSPKRVLSPGSAAQLEPIRKGSPALFKTGETDASSNQARLKLPLDDLTGHYRLAQPPPRADTDPASGMDNKDVDIMVTPQRLLTLLETQSEDVLVLDLRVSTQYAQSHISTALNLCIPTTLLKRASYTANKLAETFHDGPLRTKFERWRTSKYIIVYDTASSQLKDAQMCINIIKKFQGEGYKGTPRVLKGGYATFSRAFPQQVESSVDAPGGPQIGGVPEGLGGAPVIGGCPMPLTDKPANPFFGNIRQNMDLIGGVGQIALKHPSRATAALEDRRYPGWLRNAAEDVDQGKRVSTKFEAIERREKKRMEDALSGQVSYGSPLSPRGTKVPSERKTHQIAGIEKGAKNRYNNIWPFEHSRVRLQGVPKSACDYFNASFIQAAWSNKRYISTQAPVPATFNDFWNVVWQQDARVIVMLTAEKEGAQVKAHNYWDEKRYGPLHLEFLSEKRASLEPSRIHNAQKKRPQAARRTSTRSAHPGIPLATIDPAQEKNLDQPYVTVRKFTLSHERYPFEPMREITQLQYSSWPDFGAPAHPAHLLGLVEQTDAVVRATNHTHCSKDPDAAGERPVVVHCSAGCGRTGTFCTVDSVIDMLKRQRISQRDDHADEMDVDTKTPQKADRKARQTQPQLQHPSQPQPQQVKPPTDFFTVLLDPSAHKNEGIDGPWLHSDTIDLVEKTVEDFRNQRISMVQSLRQFVLCYESIMEWIFEEDPLPAGDEEEEV